MSHSLVSIRGASFGYGNARIVSDVDLELRSGSFLGVIGPNGSGKTTLLRGILGLIPPRAGEVEHRDVVLGYVPQREHLDPVYPLTVAEVVEMGGYGHLSGFRKLSRVERRKAERERLEQALDEVGLVPRRRELFSSLSGGQRQRALIARALMARPNVLLLDEPTSGVDQPTRESILDLLVRLNGENGMAIVIVSHQISMTEAVGEVLWVNEGRTRIGAPAEMLQPQALAELFRGAAEQPRSRRATSGRSDPAGKATS